MTRSTDKTRQRGWFTSGRERRLWALLIAVMLALYTTLGPARVVADFLRDLNLLRVTVGTGFAIAAAAGLFAFARQRPGWREWVMMTGVISAYAWTALRLSLPPEERTHLLEYALVAILTHSALKERVRNGGRVRAAWLVAFALTLTLGFIDELVQLVLPNRVFDWIDVGFNALAAMFGTLASVIVGRTADRVAPPSV